MSIGNVFQHVFETVEETGKYFDLTQEMNKRLAVESVSLPPILDQSYRVSSVIKLCPREEVLRYLHQVPKVEKIDARLTRIFDIGKAFHTLVQNEWFSKWGWLVGDYECLNCHHLYPNTVRPKLCSQCFKGTEFFYHELEPCDKKLGVTAHLDGVLQVYGKKVVLELKTANAMSFNLITNIRRQPQESHVKQIQMYMHLTGIGDGLILYFDKNEASIHHFDIKYDPVLVEIMLENLEIARQGMRDRVVPTAKICETKSCTRAKTCPVRDLCFSK